MMASTWTPVGSAKNLVFRSSTKDFSSVRVVVFIQRHLSTHGGDKGDKGSDPLSRFLIRNRDRGNRRELKSRTHSKRDGNHGVRAPELQPSDHRRSAGEQLIREQREVLEWRKLSNNLAEHLTAGAHQL